MFADIDLQHERAKKKDEEDTAQVNENIRMKREALDREETGKIQQMRKENDKMLEFYNNSSGEMQSVRTSHV